MKIIFQPNRRYSLVKNLKTLTRQKIPHDLAGLSWTYLEPTETGNLLFKTQNGTRELTEAQATILFPQVKRNYLSERWGFDSTLLGKWAAADKHEKRLRLLHAGMAVTTETPLIPIDQLEATCNERGFTVAELCRWSDYSRNSLKGFGIDEKRVVRLWDLINGAKEMYIICQ